MHHIHRTKAFVLKSLPIKEADRQLILLTEELGVIRAIAQGSRKMESKMRQSIQDFSLVDAALVSGRTGWRLVNVAFTNNFNKDISNEDLKTSIFRVFSLVQRLIADELAESEIFPIILGLIDFAKENESDLVDEKTILPLETITIARILHALGYFDESRGSARSEERSGRLAPFSRTGTGDQVRFPSSSAQTTELGSGAPGRSRRIEATSRVVTRRSSVSNMEASDSNTARASARCHPRCERYISCTGDWGPGSRTSRAGQAVWRSR